jgi:hypothetical protein
MLRNTLAFAFGLLVAVIPVNLFSVYVVRDVDADMRSKLGQAFINLTIEMLAFIAVASFIFGTAGYLIVRFLKLHPVKDGKSLSLWLGAALILMQYVLDIGTRMALKNEVWTAAVLHFLLFVAPAICAIILIAARYSRDTKAQSPPV